MKIKKVDFKENTDKYIESVRSKLVKSDLNYGRIGLMADADHDGAGAIVPLLLNFFYLWPELFEQEKIVSVRSPKYIFTKGKKCVYIYTDEEYEKVKDKYSGWECRYIKGLGSLRDHELSYVLEHEEYWDTIEIDDPECFRIMFSDDVQARRNVIGF